MPVATAEVIADVADRLFSAIEKSDVDAVDRLWSDGIAVWRPGARRDDDKARALRVIDWFVTATTERHYEILDRQLFDSATISGFVQQHVLHATGHAGPPSESGGTSNQGRVPTPGPEQSAAGHGSSKALREAKSS